MTRAFPFLLAAVLLPFAGCSALGLDRFDFPNCEMEDQCPMLNMRDGLDPVANPDLCMFWQCQPGNGQCAFLPRDADRDQHPSMEACADEGIAGADDCDDTDPEAFPGNEEACNGSDDDCDGVVDDAYAAELVDPVVVLETTSDPQWLRAQDLAEGGVALAFGASMNVAGFGVVTATDVPTPAGDPLTPAVPMMPGRDVFQTDAERTITRGCVSGNFGQTERTCTTAMDCPGATDVCVPRTGGLDPWCEAPTAMPPPGYDAEDCRVQWDCDDGVYCNGTPLCRPTALAVDEFHCDAPARPIYACQDTERCDEERRGCTTYVPGACDIAHVAIAPTHSGEWFAPFVSTMSCDAGTIRVGYFDDRGMSPDYRFPQRDILQRGDERRTTAYLGVDASDEGSVKCTGSTRPAGAPRGASGLVAASIPPSTMASTGRRRPQALLAFLAAPYCREHGQADCTMGGAPLPGRDGEVDVEVIGAWFEEGRIASSSSELAWVNATGDGVPTRLGVTTTATARRPALDEYVDGESAGWVLAYPQSGGGVALHVIPAFDDPAPDCAGADPARGAPCLETAPPYRTRFAANDEMLDRLEAIDRRSDPLVVPAAQAAFTDATITGDVAIALGAPIGGEVRIAIAWAEADQMALGTATLAIATGTITPDAAIMRFPVASLRDFALVYVSTGLRTMSERTDGFVLTWVAMDGTYGARIDSEGQMLAPGHVRIGPPVDHARAFVAMEPIPETPDETDRRAVVRVIGHQPSRMGFVAFPGVCGLSPG